MYHLLPPSSLSLCWYPLPHTVCAFHLDHNVFGTGIILLWEQYLAQQGPSLD